ncbi:protein Star-like [Ruditapes philippinarum]|uniref:protein Star-like n=1 Tax=Ruditapes philippinarum TaxID=129788 RepID=UPI00295BD190|nr:protein Star-like [Ruditapes philippinarum]
MKIMSKSLRVSLLFSSLLFLILNLIGMRLGFYPVCNELLQSNSKQHGTEERYTVTDERYEHLDIHLPSKLPYNLTNPEIENQSHGQTQFIDRFLKNMTNGFFIESGAFDGEYLSNSLFFERFRNWTGLLVEPNPFQFKRLMNKNRKAYAINACLSEKNYSSVETFNVGNKDYLGGSVVQKETHNLLPQHIRVKCHPLILILQAINRFEVDYFSLDIEGAEYGVLSLLPWERIKVNIFSIEHNKWPGGKLNLIKFMEKRGYKLLTEIKRVGVAPDYIFKKTSENLL